jgi:hypothetical protein
MYLHSKYKLPMHLIAKYFSDTAMGGRAASDTAISDTPVSDEAVSGKASGSVIPQEKKPAKQRSLAGARLFLF